jgi:hypothetical protein
VPSTREDQSIGAPARSFASAVEATKGGGPLLCSFQCDSPDLRRPTATLGTRVKRKPRHVSVERGSSSDLCPATLAHDEALAPYIKRSDGTGSADRDQLCLNSTVKPCPAHGEAELSDRWRHDPPQLLILATTVRRVQPHSVTGASRATFAQSYGDEGRSKYMIDSLAVIDPDQRAVHQNVCVGLLVGQTEEAAMHRASAWQHPNYRNVHRDVASTSVAARSSCC